MKIVLLKGGLGNQMFQYAAARGACKSEENVIIDFIFLKKNSQTNQHFSARQFELNIFKNANLKLASRFLICILHSNHIALIMLRYLFFLRCKKVVQTENEFVHELKPIKPLYLDGYFQSEKYFLQIRANLLHEFRFPALDAVNNDLENRIYSFKNAVSLHVRRGDYVNPEIEQYMGLLSKNYYYNAINLIEQTVDHPFFFIFSNDPDWCQQAFSKWDSNCIIISGNLEQNAWKDMYLMTCCKHHIIANSSFSWWGAWLSNSIDGIKIAPKQWFNPKRANFDINDFVPSSWQLLENE